VTLYICVPILLANPLSRQKRWLAIWQSRRSAFATQKPFASRLGSARNYWRRRLLQYLASITLDRAMEARCGWVALFRRTRIHHYCGRWSSKPLPRCCRGAATDS